MNQMDAFKIKSYYKLGPDKMMQKSSCFFVCKTVVVKLKFLLALISHEMKCGLAFTAGKVFILLR